jgi:GNAT superfamily N-acetyltransferase
MQSSIHIATLGLSDIEAAFHLALLEGWNQTRNDWLRLLKHEPNGCFGAYSDSRLVGTVTTAVYGEELAWLGMMLVERDYRGSGIGRRLMLAALEYTKAEGVITIKLDATPAGQTLYKAMGFVPETGIERWERSGTASRVVANSIAIEDAIMNDIHKIDRLVFGADRATMLESLLQQGSAQPSMVRNPAEGACGYAIARPGSRAVYVGPIISLDPLLTSALVDQMIGQFANQAIYVDFCKGSTADSKLLSTRGFIKQRDLTRMYWGKPSAAGLSPSMFSIAGPEIG